MGALDDLAKFRARLGAAISNALEREVFAAVSSAMKEQIQTQVYDKLPGGKPKHYERRRGDGGLLDDNNISCHLETPTILIVSNTTKDLGHMLPEYDTENALNGDVVEAVESGEGYTWRDNIPARPFHKPTEDAVVQKGTAKAALIRGLERQGFNAE